MPRIIAACLVIFGFGNAAAGFFRSGLDANIWWIDLRALPAMPGRAVMAAFCGALIAYAVAPKMPRWRRIVTVVAVATIALLSVANIVSYYLLLSRGEIRTTLPLPLSALVAASLSWILLDLLRAHDNPVAPN